MVTRETLMDLFQHMEWADAAVWNAIVGAETASDLKLKELLYHLHMVQRAFLRLWRGEPREAPYPTFEDMPSQMAWARRYYGEALSHLRTMNDESISAPLAVPWAAIVEQQLGRTPATTTIGETAMQVALHSQYHRGQINARLREIGGIPPLVDYIAWVWLGRPRPTWPESTGNSAP